MNPIEINLMGRTYQLACAPGEEKKVMQLAALVEEKMQLAAKSGQGAIGEIRLVLLAALMLADDVLEQKTAGESAVEGMQRKLQEDEDLIVSAVDHLATRINALAVRMESN
jgi:cell division protein ZapA